MASPTDLPPGAVQRRAVGARALLAARLTETVQQLWPDIHESERKRLLHQTTVEGIEMAIADIRRARS